MATFIRTRFERDFGQLRCRVTIFVAQTFLRLRQHFTALVLPPSLCFGTRKPHVTVAFSLRVSFVSCN